MEIIPINEIKVNMVNVKSSNIARIGYNEKAVILAIEMLNSNLYYYLDVPRLIYEQLLTAPAIGSYFSINMKGKYRYVRIN